MIHLSRLFEELDQTTRTSEKLLALGRYFDAAPDNDKIFAIALFTGRRPKRTVNTTQMKNFAVELSGIPGWLFEESYHIVGDLSETITLLLPPPTQQSDRSLSYWLTYLRDLQPLDEEGKKKAIMDAWMQLKQQERFVFNKLITGGFRIGVSQNLLVQALSRHLQKDPAEVAYMLTGNWDPFFTDYRELVSGISSQADQSKPYPFYLAYPLEDSPETLGHPEEWIAEKKWDGIRGQLVIRNGNAYLWSRGEELVTEKYPEIRDLAFCIPDGTVIDGEILPFKDGKPLGFSLLQKRIGRKTVGKKLLEEVPVVMMTYDILEWEGKDIRHLALSERKQILQSLAGREIPGLVLSESVNFSSWEELAAVRAQSRVMYCEGLMLKRKNSVYRSGRKRGDWWKWKIDPMTVDAVMIYAQQGHGRRANLFTDYTFAVWDGQTLVPFTKAYSGLTDEEIREVDTFVKKNTIEKFGPVRSVIPELVMEIGFEGINASTRHKSGVALRFPRILRWRKDKKAEEANTKEDLLQLLKYYEGM